LEHASKILAPIEKIATGRGDGRWSRSELAWSKSPTGPRALMILKCSRNRPNFSLTPPACLQICTSYFMLVCMKPSRGDTEDLRRRLQSARKKQQLTVTDIGRLARVHPSQVGRILRGEFRTMSHNVAQICRVLGIEPAPVGRPAIKRDATWALLERNLQLLWDGSPRRARQIARLLGALAKLND
jgi:transcriptional regulator with XRE-family HTH domain